MQLSMRGRVTTASFKSGSNFGRRKRATTGPETGAKSDRKYSYLKVDIDNRRYFCLNPLTKVILSGSV